MKKIILVIFIIFIASNLFAQWTEQNSGVTTNLESVSVIDNNNVWVCGASGIVLRTVNGGTNWIIVTSPNSALELSNIWGLDQQNALVTGSSASAAFVYKTTNGGANWTQVFTQTGGFIDAIIGQLSSGRCFMYGDPVGGKWSLWHSSDYGSTWDSTGTYLPQSGSEAGWNNALGGATLPNGIDGYAWFGTNNSRIYCARDGSNWVAQPTPGIPNIYTILFKDSLNGIAGGSTGMAYTSNGGANWFISLGSLGTGNITGIAVKSTELWYARGTQIWYSPNDSVFSAIHTITGTYYHMSQPKTANNFNIYAVGSGGAISKYTYPIGITPISSEIPKSFSLSQNYPNPFNPATKIKFEVPVKSDVNIVIRDIVGRTVSDLYNGNLNAGTYEASWDGSNNASGVYFIQLTSGNFRDTKKMVLVK